MRANDHVLSAVDCFNKYEAAQQRVDRWEKEARRKTVNSQDAAILLRGEKGYKDAVAERAQFCERAMLHSSMAIMLRLSNER
jgi:hypothetical protein